MNKSRTRHLQFPCIQLYKNIAKQELSEDLVNMEERTMLAESRMSVLTQDRESAE